MTKITYMTKKIVYCMKIFRAEVPEEVHKKVKAYAGLHGCKVPEAYKILIEKSLTSEEFLRDLPVPEAYKKIVDKTLDSKKSKIQK